MTPGCYTVAELCTLLHLSRSSFYEARDKGRLPFLEELRPRIGRVLRYRADLVDRYLAGAWKPAPVAVPGRRYFKKAG
jgi:excisionase family DNA binding protein